MSCATVLGSAIFLCTDFVIAECATPQLASSMLSTHLLIQYGCRACVRKGFPRWPRCPRPHPLYSERMSDPYVGIGGAHDPGSVADHVRVGRVRCGTCKCVVVTVNPVVTSFRSTGIHSCDGDELMLVLTMASYKFSRRMTPQRPLLTDVASDGVRAKIATRFFASEVPVDV